MQLFSKLVQDLAAGQADIDVANAIAELIQAVKETGKGGKLTLTLGVAPLQKGNPEQLTVGYDIRVKKPAVIAAMTVMFPTEDNSLTRRDPRQPELSGLRDAKVLPHHQKTESAT